MNSTNPAVIIECWAENPRDEYEQTHIMAVITLLDGVEDSIREAEKKLHACK